MLNLPKDKFYLLACSFGPDSMALFDMMLKEGYKFAIAHVNYHFRKESDEEEKGLLDYCVEKGIDIFVHDNQIIPKNNIEARARKIRYDFFKSIYKENNFDGLVIAHNQDDNIETYIIQKTRGNNPLFYGIAEFSTQNGMNIYRPLLNKTKQELLRYCDFNSVPFAIDQSNYDLRFLRNKVRHNLVEHMSNYEREHYVKMIGIMNYRISNELNKIDLTKINEVTYLKSLSSDLFRYAIILMANKENIYNISKNDIASIKDVINSSKGNIILTNRRFTFIKEYGKCLFYDKDCDTNYSYVIKEPSELDTPYFKLDFRGDTSNRNVSLEDYPLTIRNVNKNDVVKIKDYKKKANRLFIDWKMPTIIRNRWPAIVNKDGVVIYIPRYRSDFKVDEKSNFLVKII